MGIIKGVNDERRRVRWSDSKKTTKVFVATLITIIIFIVFVALFSWGIAAIMSLAG